jgi:hypothetical protein
VRPSSLPAKNRSPFRDARTSGGGGEHSHRSATHAVVAAISASALSAAALTEAQRTNLRTGSSLAAASGAALTASSSASSSSAGASALASSSGGCVSLPCVVSSVEVHPLVLGSRAVRPAVRVLLEVRVEGAVSISHFTFRNFYTHQIRVQQFIPTAATKTPTSTNSKLHAANGGSGGGMGVWRTVLRRATLMLRPHEEGEAELHCILPTSLFSAQQQPSSRSSDTPMSSSPAPAAPLVPAGLLPSFPSSSSSSRRFRFELFQPSPNWKQCSLTEIQAWTTPLHPPPPPPPPPPASRSDSGGGLTNGHASAASIGATDDGCTARETRERTPSASVGDASSASAALVAEWLRKHELSKPQSPPPLQQQYPFATPPLADSALVRRRVQEVVAAMTGR